MTAPNHPVRDQWHVLPHAGAQIDPRARPFVGNECIEDNLLESGQVALWNVTGRAGTEITLSVEGETIRIAGHVSSTNIRDAVLSSVRTAVSPATVIDDLVVTGPTETTPLAGTLSQSDEIGRPLARVRRFCSLTDASLSAAIRDGLDHLEGVLARNGVPPSPQTLVIYRNRGPSTITVDVGRYVDAAWSPKDGEIKHDVMPGGADLSVQAEAGIDGLLHAHALLLGQTNASEHEAVCWQIFETDRLRPWTGLPDCKLHLALNSVVPRQLHSATLETSGRDA